MGIYSQMESAYADNNNYFNNKSKEKLYDYTLLDKSFSSIRKGICSSIIITYRCDDENIYKFKDIETGEWITTEEFYVWIKERK